MIIQTTYIAETKHERKSLNLIQQVLQGAGVEVEFLDGNPSAKECTLTIKESRRKRRSAQEIAEAAVSSGDAHP